MSVQVSYKKQFFFGVLLLMIILVSVEICVRIYEYLAPPCDFIGADAFKDVSYSLQRQMCLDSRYMSMTRPSIQLNLPNQH